MTTAELERRPLLVACLGLILGLTLVRHPVHLLFLIPVPFALHELRARALFAAGFVLGALLGPGQPPVPLVQREFTNADWQVRTLPKITPYGQRCEIAQGDLRLMLTYAGGLGLCPGQTVHVVGVAMPPAEGMDQYYGSRNLVGRIFVQGEYLQVVGEGPWFHRLGCAWRDRFLALAAQSLPPSAASSTSALCFNADGLLDDSTREEMQRTGTTHIIAASGLQVVVLAQGLLWLLMWLPIPRWLQLVLAAGIVGLYAIATGLHPPVVRSGLMWLLANAAYLVRREPDWLSGLAASSILYLLISPSTVYDMGFQFSVIVVLFMSLFSEDQRWKPGSWAKFQRGARSSLRAAVIAFVVVTPLVAYHFGVVSLVSIPVNLLVAIAVAPVVVVAMLALPVSAAIPGLGTALMKATLPFSGYIDSVLHAYGGDRAAFYVAPFSAYWLLPFYALLLMLWRPVVRQP